MNEFPAFEKKPNPDLNDLLLTPEQEAKIEQPEGSTKKIELRYGDQSLMILGVEHTSNEERISSMINELDSYAPDLVLVEGTALLHVSDEEIIAMPEEEVRSLQEQAYVYWHAKLTGKKVLSWDLPAGGEIREALKLMNEQKEPVHSKDDAIDWHITYAIKKMLESDMVISPNSIISVISQSVPSAAEILDLSAKVVEESLHRVFGTDSPELELANEYSDPRTNAFARDMNMVRDRHAISLLQKAQEKGFKKIFVSAGRSHAYTWEPAVKELYSS